MPTSTQSTEPQVAPGAANAKPQGYRRDIDGLRAIAVLAVVGFHAEIGLFRGGFSGVDVFFVISGYLISGIIFRSLAKNTFSFAGFYAHRINRIFPALGVVLVATIVLGWFVLFPPEFEQLGKHVAGGAGFVSNFVLWSETGYFDSKNKLLLHLWSLGVEEQFYIVWPLLIVMAWRQRWSISATILGIAVASFGLNVWAVGYSDRTLAFYFPLTRLWELLAGALFSWIEFRRTRAIALPRFASNIASGIGLTLIAATIARVNQDMAWPGWLAVAPIIATILIIGPGRESFINRKFLGSSALVGIGLISYPLYLWHWPLLVLGRLVNEAQLPRMGRLGIVAISILLAWATYEWVEKPIRFGSRKRRSAAILFPLMAGVGLFGFAVSNGFPKPLLNRAYDTIVTNPEKLPHGTYFNRAGTDIITPTLTGDTTRIVALVGDSHATQYWPRLEQLETNKRFEWPQVVLMAYGGCPPFPTVNHFGISWDGVAFRCPEVYEKTQERLRNPHVTTIVYSACWECFFNEGHLFFVSDPRKGVIGRDGPAIVSLFSLFESEVARQIESGKQVYIVLPNPNSPLNSPASMLPRRLPWLTPKSFERAVRISDVDKVNGYARTLLRAVAARTGAAVIDPVAAVCTTVACPTVTAEGNAIYSDDHHFRPEYVRFHATFIDVVLQPREVP